MFPAAGKENQHSKLIGMCGTIHVKDGYFDDLSERLLLFQDSQ